MGRLKAALSFGWIVTEDEKLIYFSNPKQNILGKKTMYQVVSERCIGLCFDTILLISSGKVVSTGLGSLNVFGYDLFCSLQCKEAKIWVNHRISLKKNDEFYQQHIQKFTRNMGEGRIFQQWIAWLIKWYTFQFKYMFKTQSKRFFI